MMLETPVTLSFLGSTTIYAKGKPRITPQGRLWYLRGDTPWIVTTAHRGSRLEQMPNQTLAGTFTADDATFCVFLEEVWWEK